MKTLIATLFATLLLATTVNADAPQYKVEWTFTQLTNEVHYEDYSTNLDIPLAATLPTAAVKAGWACVRESVVSNNQVGDFYCSNGKVWQYVVATCTDDRINTDHRSMTLQLPGAPRGITFTVACQTIPR
jgi:hypothetical protein